MIGSRANNHGGGMRENVWARLLSLAAAAALVTHGASILMIYLYATLLSLTGGVVSNGGHGDRISQFGYFMGVVGAPAIFLGLVTLTAAFAVRRFGLETVHGGALGLSAAAFVQLLGLALGTPQVSDLVVYFLLGLAGGVVGSARGRTELRRQEALYRASREINAARSPRAIASAIGPNLSEGAVAGVSLWLDTGSGSLTDAPDELVLEGIWTPESEPAKDGVTEDEAPEDGLRLDADLLQDLPRKREGSGPDSFAGVRVEELPEAQREPYRRRGVRSLWFFPLSTAGGEVKGRLAVETTHRGLSRTTTRAALTVSPQAALARENIRLLEEARKAAVLSERQRMSHEIHDTLAQGFTSIVMNLEAAEGALENDSPQTRRHLEQARLTARGNLTEARRLVWALQPEQLESTSLPEAVSVLCARWSQESGIACSARVAGTPRALAPEIETVLLRAAQESLSNVRKHARAGQAALTLTYMDDTVLLDARDDGVGFGQHLPPSTGEPGGGFGLQAMRERVERLGGGISIESEPGRGTALAIELPLCTGTLRQVPDEHPASGNDLPDHDLPTDPAQRAEEVHR